MEQLGTAFRATIVQQHHHLKSCFTVIRAYKLKVNLFHVKQLVST